MPPAPTRRRMRKRAGGRNSLAGDTLHHSIKDGGRVARKFARLTVMDPTSEKAVFRWRATTDHAVIGRSLLGPVPSCSGRWGEHRVTVAPVSDRLSEGIRRSGTP